MRLSVRYFWCKYCVLWLIVLAGEYRVRPGAGTSRGISSEDANAPALSPYEMRTRKRIVHIMKVFRQKLSPQYFCCCFVIIIAIMLHHHTSRSFSVLNPSLCMSCLPPCYCSTCAPMASAKTVSPPTRSCVFFATPYAAASWSVSPPHLVICACLSDPPSGRIPTHFTQQSR